MYCRLVCIPHVLDSPRGNVNDLYIRWAVMIFDEHNVRAFACVCACLCVTSTIKIMHWQR